jgi:hypothetical protein
MYEKRRNKNRDSLTRKKPVVQFISPNALFQIYFANSQGSNNLENFKTLV